jgi:hypothetical protein
MGEGLWKGSLRGEMEASLVDRVGQMQGEVRPIFRSTHLTLAFMSETLKIPALEDSNRGGFVAEVHRLQPEKPGRVMKCPH